MNKEEDILYNQTQDFGRTQFVRELARLMQENKEQEEYIKYWQNEYDKKMVIIDKALEMFESDEHFEDGCYCIEIEELLKRGTNENTK